MKNVKYQLRLWQIRSELQSKGIHKPVNELIKLKKITPDKRFSNLLLGRTEDPEFLKMLEDLNNSIE